MTEPKRHYTVKRLAEEWACDIGTIYKLINSKMLGCIKIGAAIRIPVSSKEAYEEQNTLCPESRAKNQTLNSEESPENLSTTSHGRKIVGHGAFQRAQMMRSQQSNISPTL